MKKELKKGKNNYMDREYYEEYVRNNLGIPYVCFEGLEISVIECIVESLENIFSRYPAVASNIVSIGDRDNINNQYNLIINSSKFKKIEWDDDFIVDDDLDMTAIVLYNKSPKKYILGERFVKNDYMALVYFDDIKNRTLEDLDNDAREGVNIGYNPTHCDKFQFVVYHEMGHILDYTLGLRYDKEFVKMIKKISDNYKLVSRLVSDYATLNVKKDPSELIADAFSEYIMSDDTNYLVKFIGNYIDYKYNKYEYSKLFGLNGRYQISKARKIIKKSKYKKY